MKTITEKKEMKIKDLIKMLWAMNLNQPVTIECVSEENRLFLINAKIVIEESSIV